MNIASYGYQCCINKCLINIFVLFTSHEQCPDSMHDIFSTRYDMLLNHLVWSGSNNKHIVLMSLFMKLQNIKLMHTAKYGTASFSCCWNLGWKSSPSNLRQHTHSYVTKRLYFPITMYTSTNLHWERFIKNKQKNANVKLATSVTHHILHNSKINKLPDFFK